MFEFIRSLYQKIFPLTPQEQIHQIFRQSPKREILSFTYDDMVEDMRNMPLAHLALFVCAKDLALLAINEKFASVFDPVTKASTLQRGYAGTFLGIKVITDAHFASEDQFLPVSYYVNLDQKTYHNLR